MKNKGVAIILAIFFNFFTWLYTYEKDKTLFWIGLIINILLFWTIIVPILTWLVAVIMTVARSSEVYEKIN